MCFADINNGRKLTKVLFAVHLIHWFVIEAKTKGKQYSIVSFLSINFTASLKRPNDVCFSLPIDLIGSLQRRKQRRAINGIVLGSVIYLIGSL